MWKYIKDNLDRTKCTSTESLKDEIRRVWCLEASKDQCSKLVESIPRRLHLVIINSKYHKFPINNSELCKKWIVAIKSETFIPTEHSRIFSDHFLPLDYSIPDFNNKPKLKPFSVPSITPCNNIFVYVNFLMFLT